MVSIVYNNLTIPLHEVDMTVSYKITYEHRDGDQIRMEEVLFYSEHEPTKDEIHDAVRKDTVRFNSPSNGVTAVSGFKVISVVPVP
ncbi:hypothetical protein ACJHYK_12000 [Escherichia sp. WS1853]|uniref:hypothetical protein n=1 Tax=Escherichia sp. WS1853 TaxID=3381950 RepID=UPI00396F5752